MWLLLLNLHQKSICWTPNIPQEFKDISTAHLAAAVNALPQTYLNNEPKMSI